VSGNRLQPVDGREVGPGHASTLGEVFLRARTDPQDTVQQLVDQIADDLSGQQDTVQQLVDQIAHDLSGRLGEQHVIKYRGAWRRGYGSADQINFHGEILHNGERVGLVDMTARLDGQRGLMVSASVTDVRYGPGLDRAQLLPALRATLEPYFERSGVDHIDSPFLATTDHPLGTGDTPDTSGGPASGGPVEGSREWYRLQPVDGREVDPGHASTLGEVFLRARTDPHHTVQQLVDQIAHDLSGGHGEHVIKYRGGWLADQIKLGGVIFHNGAAVGRVDMTARLDDQRGLMVSVSVQDVYDGVNGPVLDRAQLLPALRAVLEPYFERSGVDHIEWPDDPPVTPTM
jgi:hypothetical protein